MVNNDAQLYTIEGIAASLIMIMTLFFVVNSTSVYTPGDAHISDMQLEVLGTDALQMMDTASTHDTDSPLKTIIEFHQPDRFKSMFLNYTNNRTLDGPDYIKFNASYSCRDTSDNSISTTVLGGSHTLNGGEHAVRVTRWVRVNKAICNNFKQDRVVLMEVLLWRD
jgi:hypothetical protein